MKFAILGFALLASTSAHAVSFSGTVKARLQLIDSRIKTDNRTLLFFENTNFLIEGTCGHGLKADGILIHQSQTSEIINLNSKGVTLWFGNTTSCEVALSVLTDARVGSVVAIENNALTVDGQVFEVKAVKE